MLEALYIHIPFCQAKCNYCDFNSSAGWTVDLQERYVEALKREALLRKQNLPMNIKSIFFGGGTPTCLPGGLFANLLDFLKETFPLASEVEITSEANPGTVDQVKLELLLKKGVNRLSFGVQSFNETLLKRLGRIHSSEDIDQSFRLAREAGFTNINFDLMYGLPGQSLSDWESTLLKVLELDLEHISLYQLKIEEGTPFGHQLEQGLLEEFDDELALEMYKMTNTYLSQSGFIHYEVSNYAKSGYECRHNQVYWRCEPYLGLGAGAHSYLPPNRIENTNDITTYIALLEKGLLPQLNCEELTLPIAMSEAMFMGLRLIKGINLEHFHRRFDQDPRKVFKKPIERCLARGLIEIDQAKNLKFTPQGLYLGNLVFEEFLLDN